MNLGAIEERYKDAEHPTTSPLRFRLKVPDSRAPQKPLNKRDTTSIIAALEQNNNNGVPKNRSRYRWQQRYWI
jgi:hypothetical protein